MSIDRVGKGSFRLGVRSFIFCSFLFICLNSVNFWGLFTIMNFLSSF